MEDGKFLAQLNSDKLKFSTSISGCITAEEISFV